MNQDEMLKALKDLDTPIAFITPNIVPITTQDCDCIVFYGTTLCNAITLAYKVLVLGDYYAQSTDS